LIRAPTLSRNQVDQDKAILALRLLLEGNGIRSTERITGIDRNTIVKLLHVPPLAMPSRVGR
jgi:hypothetical protein